MASSNKSFKRIVSPDLVLIFLPSSAKTNPKGTWINSTFSGMKLAFWATWKT